MPSYFGKKFDRALRRLREEIPLGAEMIVRTVKPEKVVGLCGLCWIHEVPTSFIIEVSRELSEVAAIDTLIHEYAHCMDHQQNGNSRKEHRNSWGVCYAKCYRVVHKE